VLGSGFDDGSDATFTLDGTPTPKVRTNHTQFVNPSELRANITVALDAVIDFYDIEVVTTRGKKGIGADKFQVVAKGGGVGNSLPDPAIAVGAGLSELWVVDADGTNRTELLDDAVWTPEPSWAPFGDGSAEDPYRIAFSGCIGLEVIDVDTVGGSLHVLNRQTIPTTTSATCHPAWSPLGDEIAYGGAQEPPWASGLFVIGTAGGTPTLLYAPAPGNTVRSPAWEASGLAIAFTEYPFLKIYHRLTGNVTTIIDNAAELNGVWDISWARTRDELAVLTGSGVYTIALARDANDNFVQSSDPLLLVARAQFGGASWAPDDTELVFPGRGGIVSYDLASGKIRKLSEGQWPDWRRF
jgi:hypothetical protein